MYYATIYDYHGADYRFGSASFKWVFGCAIAFAKRILFKNPEYQMIDIYLDSYVINVYRGYYVVRRV